MKILHADFPTIEEIKAQVEKDYIETYSDKPLWVKDTILAARLEMYYRYLYNIVQILTDDTNS
jgi:hypothetical protein